MFIGTAIFDDRRRDRAMPLPTADAIKRAGIVEAIEVERGDGRIEVRDFDTPGPHDRTAHGPDRQACAFGAP